MTTTPKPDAGGHTAGPWAISVNGGVIDPDGFCVARISSLAILDDWSEKYPKLRHWAGGGTKTSRERTDAEVEANERLVAASPDLLAVAKSLRDIIHDELTHAQQQHHAEAINFADLVIGKAGGGK